MTFTDAELDEAERFFGSHPPITEWPGEPEDYPLATKRGLTLGTASDAEIEHEAALHKTLALRAEFRAACFGLLADAQRATPEAKTTGDLMRLLGADSLSALIAKLWNEGRVLSRHRDAIKAGLDAGWELRLPEYVRVG